MLLGRNFPLTNYTTKNLLFYTFTFIFLKQSTVIVIRYLEIM
jgi:hypothetical protein